MVFRARRGESVPDLVLREISASDKRMLEQIGRLRVRAWATEVPEVSRTAVWLDEADATARHWIVVLDSVLVGSGRMSIHATLADVPDAGEYEGVFPVPPPTPVASLNRLVVAPEARGLGLSRRLDLARLEAAEDAGCKSVVGATSSGHRRIEQLESLGFVVIGDRCQVTISPVGLRPRPGKVLLYLVPEFAPKGGRE